VGKLKERHGDVDAAAEIEAGGYEGVEAPVKVVAVPNYLVVNRSMDPELAYRLTKLLFDQKDALAGVLAARAGHHPNALRHCPWSPPRSAAAPWSSATAGRRCSLPADARPLVLSIRRG
jgi:NMT1-like family